MAEAELTPDADDISFDIFIIHNANDMGRIIEENRQRFGYVFFLFREQLTLSLFVVFLHM